MAGFSNPELTTLVIDIDGLMISTDVSKLARLLRYRLGGVCVFFSDRAIILSISFHLGHFFLIFQQASFYFFK